MAFKKVAALALVAMMLAMTVVGDQAKEVAAAPGPAADLKHNASYQDCYAKCYGQCIDLQLSNAPVICQSLCKSQCDLTNVFGTEEAPDDTFETYPRQPSEFDS